MKKSAAILICLLSLLLALSAQASDRYPTNPFRTKDMELTLLDQQLRLQQDTAGIRPKGSQSGRDFHLNIVTEPSFSAQGVLKIVPEISGTFNYMAQVYIDALPNIYGLDNGMLYSLRNIEDSTIILPELVVPADYRVTLFCYDQSDPLNLAGWATYEFTLEPDGSHPTLDSVLDSVLSQCQVSGDDWQTALNLHDWLTHHAHYDGTYTNYGPDGVLVKGTGVCDSYSKAYFLLLKKAGIPVQRVIADSMNHAWNIVCFDGDWTQVDVTWDDPGAMEGPIVSGQEYHHFFAVSDEFFQDSKYGHSTHYGYEIPYECTTMAHSAILKLREEWPFVDTWYSNYTTGTYTDMIQQQLDEGQTAFDIPLYDKISAGGNSYYWTSDFIGDFYLYALIQSFNSWTDSQGIPLTLNIVFDESAMALHVTARPDLPETGTLVLPDHLLTLEAEAFSGVKASTVFVPDGCQAIGPLAFSASGVHTVHIPASVVTIDATAFDGCTFVTICAPEGSAAADFALANGLQFIAE